MIFLLLSVSFDSGGEDLIEAREEWADLLDPDMLQSLHVGIIVRAGAYDVGERLQHRLVSRIRGLLRAATGDAEGMRHKNFGRCGDRVRVVGSGDAVL